jgi:hypothetical protein
MCPPRFAPALELAASTRNVQNMARQKIIGEWLHTKISIKPKKNPKHRQTWAVIPEEASLAAKVAVGVSPSVPNNV